MQRSDNPYTGNKAIFIITIIFLALVLGLLSSFSDLNRYILIVLILIPIIVLSIQQPWIAVVGFLFLIPLNELYVLPTGQTFNKLAGTFLAFLSIITGHIRYINEPFKNKKIIFILIYGFICLISLFYTTNLANSIYNLQRLGFFIGSYFLLIIMFRDKTKIEYILWALVIGGVFSVLAPILFNYGTIEGREVLRYGGLWGDQNEFAAILIGLLAFSVSLFFKERKKGLKLAAIVCFIILFIGFILTYSRGGYISLAVTTLIIISSKVIHGQNKLKVLFASIFTIIISVVIAYYIFNTEFIPKVESLVTIEKLESISAERSLRLRYQNYFSIGPKLFLANPVLGVGFKDFASHTPSNIVAHNTYLEVLTGVGLVGFIPFMIILFLTFKEFNNYHTYINTGREKPSSFSIATGLQFGFIAYMISSLFITSDTNKMLWVYITLSAILSNIIYINTKKGKIVGNLRKSYN